MKIINLADAPHMEFPAGRVTRILAGEGAAPTERFVQGHVVIQPGGAVPRHSHANEETYTILQGTGTMTIGSESCVVKAVSTVYIPPHQAHGLTNHSDEDLIMMFVYSPAGIVDHWADEQAGELS